MAKKRQPTRAVTFRVPVDTHELVEAVAQERGQDVTAVLNAVIAEAVPELQQWLAQRTSTLLHQFTGRYRVLCLTPRDMLIFIKVMGAMAEVKGAAQQRAAGQAVLERTGQAASPMAQHLLDIVIRGLAAEEGIEEFSKSLPPGA